MQKVKSFFFFVGLSLLFALLVIWWFHFIKIQPILY